MRIERVFLINTGMELIAMSSNFGLTDSHTDDFLTESMKKNRRNVYQSQEFKKKA